jgi:hypothetical protein
MAASATLAFNLGEWVRLGRPAIYHLKNTLDKIKNNIPLIKHNLFNTNDYGINLN